MHIYNMRAGRHTYSSALIDSLFFPPLLCYVLFCSSSKISAGYSEALNDYECGAETAMDSYLSNPAVIEALHVKADTPGLSYKKTATDLRPLYAELIDKYQMLIYSGDTDGEYVTE